MKAILNSVMMSISSILLVTLLTLGITKLHAQETVQVAQQQTVKQVEYRQTNRRLQYIDKENSHIDVLFIIYSYYFPAFSSSSFITSAPGNPVTLYESFPSRSITK